MDKYKFRQGEIYVRSKIDYKREVEKERERKRKKERKRERERERERESRILVGRTKK